MKRSLSILFSGLYLFLAGCSGDSDTTETNTTVYVSYGVVEAVADATSGAVEILTDSGKRLFATNIVSGPVADGDRVVVHYMPEEETENLQDRAKVKVIKMEHIKVQEILPASYYSSQYHDSLSVGASTTNGSIINVDDIWTGGKYLNVKYRLVRRKNSSVKHYVNCIVYMAPSATNQSGLTLGLCHGAENFREGVKEKPGSTDYEQFEYGHQEIISFDLSTLEYQWDTPLPVSVHWDAYDGTKWLEPYICTTVTGFHYPVPPEGEIPVFDTHAR